MNMRSTKEELEPSMALYNVRNQILNTLLTAITIFAILPLFASLYRISEIGWQPVMSAQLISYLIIFFTTIFQRKLSYSYKVTVLISFCFLIGCVATINMGLAGSGILFIVFSVIFATMFLGVRYGFVFIMAGLVYLVIILIGVKQRWIVFDFNIESVLLSFSTWVSKILAFTLFSTMLIFSLGRLINYLVFSSKKLKEHSVELERVNDELKNEISEKNRTQEDLKASEARYRQLIENANDAIFITQDYFIKYANRKTLEMLGISIEELLRTPFLNFIHPEDQEIVTNRHIERTSGNEKVPSTYSFRIIGNNQKEYTVELNSVLIRYQEKPATLNYLRDITETRRLEASLLQSQKMEAIGTFAGGIAHDFNNILSAIMGYAELSKIELPEEAQISGYLDSILQAGNRARELVQQILTYSRKAEQEFKPVSVKAVINEAIKLIRASLPSTIEIRLNVNSDSIILGDQTKIHQILMNLCANAGFAMREKGGILDIELKNVQLDDEFTSKYPDLKPGQYLNMTVSDNGTGMSSEVLKRIFDPFYTTKKRGEGTGMGLAVVHGIVKSHGGTIIAYSEKSMGTSFKVFLPAVDTHFEEDKQTETHLPGGNERILFIDDEPDVAIIEKQILESLGYQVVSRTSSIEALELFKTQYKKFDLVITDMTMPQMTGDKLAREIQAVRKDIPIILCTGFSHSAANIKSRDSGIKGLLMKPFLRSELAEMVRKVLDEANAHNKT